MMLIVHGIESLLELSFNAKGLSFEDMNMKG